MRVEFKRLSSDIDYCIVIDEDDVARGVLQLDAMGQWKVWRCVRDADRKELERHAEDKWRARLAALIVL